MPAGNHLSLDISTLYLVATLAAALLGAMLLFFWRQEQIAALGWWGAAYILGAASVALYTVGGGPALGWELSLAVNTVGFVACGLVWDAARVFHGRPANWVGVIAGPVVWIAAVVWLDPIDPEIRMLLGAGIVAFYAALTAAELWRERRKSLRARWPAIVIPMMHGAVLMLPILLGDMFRSGGATLMEQVWILAFAAELVLYAVGTVFIIVMLVSERTVSVHKTAASVDPLTGLLNRRGFSEATTRMIEREAKAGRPVTVMIFDIDHFKSVNDRFGHAAGDDVLKVFSDVVVSNLRITDLVGRVGGEEFAALLPCTVEEAVVAAERVREGFEASGVAVDEEPLQTTVSIGIAGGPAQTELEVLMASADTALYQAKRSGRNRVEIAVEQPLSLDSRRKLAKSGAPADADSATVAKGPLVDIRI